MSLTELTIDVPAEHMANVFGQFDSYIKKIEKAFHVTVVIREGGMKLLGEELNIKAASEVFLKLTELSKRGNTITEQNVDYMISLSATKQTDAMLEIEDCSNNQ